MVTVSINAFGLRERIHTTDCHWPMQSLPADMGMVSCVWHRSASEFHHNQGKNSTNTCHEQCATHGAGGVSKTESYHVHMWRMFWLFDARALLLHAYIMYEYS